MIDHDLDAPGIAIVRSSRAWARTLHRYVVDHGGAVVKTRPLEERQALEDEYDILIVDDISSFLTNHIVDELHRRGRRVLGVYDPEEFSGSDATGRQRLVRLGVDGVIEAQATPEAFIHLITDLAPSAAERHARATAEHGDMPEDPFLGNGSRDDGRASPRRRGHVTTVMAACGGAGATEIAIEVARGLAARGERAVVVDADEVGPSVAQRLSLPLHPNLRTAIDVVEHGTGRLAECLINVSKGLETLVGLPHPKDWAEIRGTDLTAVLSELIRGRPQVVVNTSPFVEDLSGIGGIDRFALSRAGVEACDDLIVVCPPTPMGIARLLDRLTEIAPLVEGKPLHVVVNRTPKGSFKRKEIGREIERNFNPAGIHFFDDDPKVGKAAWDGTLVPHGSFTRAVNATLTPSIPRVTTSARRHGKVRR